MAFVYYFMNSPNGHVSFKKEIADKKGFCYCAVPEKKTCPPSTRSSEILRGKGVLEVKVLEVKILEVKYKLKLNWNFLGDGRFV